MGNPLDGKGLKAMIIPHFRGTVCLLVSIAACKGERGFCIFLVYPVTFHGVHIIPVFRGII